jgi:hypothetical protein
MLSPNAAGPSTASTPHTATTARLQQLKSAGGCWANVTYQALGSLVLGLLAPGSDSAPASTPGSPAPVPELDAIPDLVPPSTDQPIPSEPPKQQPSGPLPVPTRLSLLRCVCHAVPPGMPPSQHVRLRGSTAHMAPTPAPADLATSHDLLWDAFQRNHFWYQMRSPEAITMACLAAAKPYFHGVTWSEFTVNVQDLELHPETSTISPWYCEHFDDGVVLNHPISLDVSTMDMDVFLAGFTRQGFDNKQQKEFENFFPKFDKSQHLYDYYKTVLQH